MLFALDLLREQLKQLLKMIVKVLLNSVHHSLMVVFNDAFFDVFRFKFNSLFSSGDGVHQVSVIFVLGVVEVLSVLVDDVLLFSEEVIDFVLVAIGSIILLA